MHNNVDDGEEVGIRSKPSGRREPGATSPSGQTPALTVLCQTTGTRETHDTHGRQSNKHNGSRGNVERQDRLHQRPVGVRDGVGTGQLQPGGLAVPAGRGPATPPVRRRRGLPGRSVALLAQCFHATRSATTSNGVVRAKRETVELALVCLFSEGHLLIEDGRARKPDRQDDAGAVSCRLAGRRLAPGAVHARPAALGHHRRDRLPAAEHRCVRVPAGPRLREHRARRRDQPGLSQDAVGAAAGGDGGGAAGHRGRQHPRGAAPVHG